MQISDELNKIIGFGGIPLIIAIFLFIFRNRLSLLQKIAFAVFVLLGDIIVSFIIFVLLFPETPSGFDFSPIIFGIVGPVALSFVFLLISKPNRSVTSSPQAITGATPLTNESWIFPFIGYGALAALPIPLISWLWLILSIRVAYKLGWAKGAMSIGLFFVTALILRFILSFFLSVFTGN